MIILALIESQKLPALREAFSDLERNIFVVQSFMLKGEWVSRIVFQCDEHPPGSLDIGIEAVFEEPNYCQTCMKKLQSHNVSGYCYRHQDKDPRRSQRKNK